MSLSMKEMILRAKKTRKEQQQANQSSDTIHAHNLLQTSSNCGDRDKITDNGELQQTTTLPMHHVLLNPPLYQTTQADNLSSSFHAYIPKLPQELLNRANMLTIDQVIDFITTHHKDLATKIAFQHQATTFPTHNEQSFTPHSTVSPGPTTTQQLNQEQQLGPNDYCYVPQFLTPIEELAVLTLINSFPCNQWVKLRKRHLLMFGGEVLPNGLLPSDSPQWCIDLYQKIVNCVDPEIIYPINDCNQNTSSTAATTATITTKKGKIEPNHTLLNYYQPEDSISAHYDGPSYSPLAVIISLSSSLLLSFYHPNDFDIRWGSSWNSLYQCYLQPGSLFVMKGKCYNSLLHGIDSAMFDILCPNKLLNFGQLQYPHQLILSSSGSPQHVNSTSTLETQPQTTTTTTQFEQLFEYIHSRYIHPAEQSGRNDVAKHYQSILEYAKLYQSQYTLKTVNTMRSDYLKNIPNNTARLQYLFSQRCTRISLTIRRVDPILVENDNTGDQHQAE